MAGSTSRRSMRRSCFERAQHQLNTVLFGKEAEPEALVTGIDVLRLTVHARNKNPRALALIAGEIPNVSLGMLEDFAANRGDLNVEALQALTKALYQFAVFDVESGMLKSPRKGEPKVLRAEGYSPVYDLSCRHIVSYLRRARIRSPSHRESRRPGRVGWAVLVGSLMADTDHRRR